VCGFLSLLGPTTAEALDKVGRALETLHHRGPDDQGIVSRDSTVILGHKRLSILDLSEHGRQPMTLPDRDLWLAYNGEVYNYVELRKDLRVRGHHFVSDGDSEVILRAYAEWGPDCVSRFNGMWAFVLWDGETSRLFCSRDRFGVKPFYYARTSLGVACASEIKALLALDAGLARPNLPMVGRLIGLRMTDDMPDTFFSGICQLPPASNMVIRSDGTTTISRYYDLGAEVRRQDASPVGASERLRELLFDAVRIRLRSDVPVGTCLSGGIDSSSVVAVLSRLLDERVSSFSSVYPGTDCDESRFARAVSEKFNTDAHWVQPSKDDFLEVLPHLVWHQDEPSVGAGLYSQWHVMQAAGKHVRVLLDGQGGDEVFGGYLRYYEGYAAALLRRSMLGDLRAISRLRRDSAEIRAQVGRGAVRAGARTLLSPRLKELYRQARRIEDMPGDGLLRPDFLAESPALPGPSLDVERSMDPLNRMLMNDLTQTTIPGLLHYEDRNSMAFSVEARTPFLDYRLVEFGLGLPASTKIDGWRTKAVLRDAVGDLLPPEVLGRRDKMGYPTPFSQWLREGLMDPVRQILMESKTISRGITDTGAVSRMLDEHASGVADRGGMVWILLSLESWFRTFIDRTDSSRPRAW
jgi:asparagine synthase (glutamine-hydrolysing)